MNILQINTVYGQGSTGRMAKAIHDACEDQGIRCLTGHRCNAAGVEDVNISSKWDSRLHGWFSRLTMFKGAGSLLKTARFLRQVKQFQPDIIHLHNLHGSYVNLPMLFRYIKRENIGVVWTLHDCWAFTAICPHFTIAGCDKWKSGCGKCPQRKDYARCPADMTRAVWRAKRRWFTGMPNAILVTPSDWLAGLAKQSFLSEYPIKTIHNGIDEGVFKPTTSNFREKYGLQGKKILLGVSFGWGYSKGLDVFVQLRQRLPEDYAIVLVGTDAATDRQLPAGIVSIHRTHNPQELAGIYTAADLFVNPTREENYPTVQMEAIACGTPVVAFRTGGCPESIGPGCGALVEPEDLDALQSQIVKLCADPTLRENCLEYAHNFRNDRAINAYLELYKELL